MTAHIIQFEPHKINAGNGARDALIAIAETLPGTIDHPDDAARWTDWVLAELWDRGFKVVPLTADNLS